MVISGYRSRDRATGHLPVKAQRTLGIGSISPPGSRPSGYEHELRSRRAGPLSNCNESEYRDSKYDNSLSRSSPYALQMPLQRCFNIYPFHKRCQQLESVICSYPAADLRDSYADLVADIFGIGGHAGWQLHMIDSVRDPYDFNEIRHFLGPNGCLFKFIDQLMAEHAISYSLPINLLPASAVASLESSMCLNWYSKSHVEGRLPDHTNLELNALEYYFLFFALFVSRVAMQQELLQWSSVEGVIYVQLFQDYLNHFLPLDCNVPGRHQLPMDCNRGHSNGNVAMHHRKAFTSFLYSKLNPHEHHLPQLNNMAAEFTPDGSSKAEAFVQILVSLWLADVDETPLNSSSAQLSKDFVLPTVDLARLVRMLVKHIHGFVNCDRTARHVDRNGLVIDPLVDLQRKLVPVVLESRLYSYLRHSFVYWPLDPSFRMILETWLSFIQPWRYPEVAADQEVRGPIRADVERWDHFVGMHLRFYSTLFQLFVSRALCFDFETPQDTHLLFRVSKVFSQSNLRDIIEEAETRQLEAPLMPHSHVGPLPPGLLLGPRGDYPLLGAGDQRYPRFEPMFGEISRHEVTRLIEKLAMSLSESKARRSQKEDRCDAGSSLVGRLKTFLLLTDDGRRASSEVAVVEDYLDRILGDLCHMFKIARPLIDEMERNNTSSSPDTHTSSRLPRPFLRPPVQRSPRPTDKLPDHIQTADGLILTQQGRFELVNGLRRFDNYDAFDPDLQPIRSYESAALARHLHRASASFNAKFSGVLTAAYSQCGLVSSLLRWIAMASQSRSQQHHSPSLVPRSQRAVLDAPSSAVRVSLRCFASIYTLAYLVILIGVLMFFDFNGVSLVVMVMAIIGAVVLANVRYDDINS